MKWVPLSQPTGDEFLARLQAMSPCELLGILPSASNVELKRAYRQLVSKYHPDRVDPFLKAHSDRLMRLINTAYDQERGRRAS